MAVSSHIIWCSPQPRLSSNLGHTKSLLNLADASFWFSYNWTKVLSLVVSLLQGMLCWITEGFIKENIVNGWLVGASTGFAEIDRSLSCYLLHIPSPVHMCLNFMEGVQPWLLLPHDDSKNEKYEKFLISIHERRVVYYLEIPEVLGKKEFHGSSHGWVEITLPPRYKYPDVRNDLATRLLFKVVLSSCPALAKLTLCLSPSMVIFWMGTMHMRKVNLFDVWMTRWRQQRKPMEA
ncbi:hypothetical protein H5410_043884 [Solanum commersonii]|uniref:Uncharacterized protein n=1 Tax=Solanum commersonii TaxID=4109 RepID=A0A9J5Y066_SOLCO|nr:hypothetical protein H5410_043884 [Solanum commersonii]